MQFTQTLQDDIYSKIADTAKRRGVTVQAVIAYELGEIFGPKQNEDIKPIKKP
jgi:hypothetical protein